MNELKHEDVMRALAWYEVVGKNIGSVTVPYNEIQAIADLLREKDAEIERLTKERDDARRDCAVAEQLHYECKKELEEMLDDILDSVRAERDRYKAESEQYQREMLKRGEEIEKQKALKKIATDNNHQCYRLGYEDGITEFAERLKERMREVYPADIYDSDIYEIAKEIKGELDEN